MDGDAIRTTGIIMRIVYSDIEEHASSLFDQYRHFPLILSAKDNNSLYAAPADIESTSDGQESCSNELRVQVLIA